MYEAAVLCLVVEGLTAFEGKVEAAPMHQGHLQLLPQLHYPGQQGLHVHTTAFSAFVAPRPLPPRPPLFLPPSTASRSYEGHLKAVATCTSKP